MRLPNEKFAPAAKNGQVSRSVGMKTRAPADLFTPLPTRQAEEMPAVCGMMAEEASRRSIPVARRWMADALANGVDLVEEQAWPSIRHQ
jgi:hypothetical protein